MIQSAHFGTDTNIARPEAISNEEEEKKLVDNETTEAIANSLKKKK